MEPPRRTRLPSSERRSAIIAAACSEFALNGFHGANMSRIARAAGCSEPMLYKHFTNKRALFVAVLDDVGERMEARIDQVLSQPGDPFEHWRNAVPAMFEATAYSDMVSMRMLAVTVADIPEVAEALVAANERLRDRSVAAVERARGFGSIGATVTGDYVAWMWLGITMAAASRAHSMNEPNMSALVPFALQFIDSIREVPATA